MSYATVVKIGTVTATGAAINVSIGFQPDEVEVMNISDATNFTSLLWRYGMSAANAIKRKLSTWSFITTLGISQYAGDSTHGEGFTIGADADLNVNTNVLLYRATRSVTKNT